MNASPRAHLDVNGFLATELDARAIRAGLELGLIDRLHQAPVSLAELMKSSGVAPRGLILLVDMLEANQVVARQGDRLELTPGFRDALRFRDLLEARIAFADLVWPDVHELFNALLTDVPQFMARSKTFELFRYDRCFEATPDNLAATRAWTRFTTCLTKYEADAAFDEIDLDGVADFVDFGGNTGEFSLALCRRRPTLRATVVDLPVVCEIGRQHVAADAECASRISFHACDMRRDSLPPPADLVSFKSVLHDWPDADARRLIARARDVVRPGGRLMIFERAPLDFGGRRIPYGLAPDLVFLHFLRGAELYLDTLRELGFVDLDYRRVALELDFHFIVARRPEERKS